MLLGGLWHGAGFRFLLWGAMHGIALGIHKFYIQIFPNRFKEKKKLHFQFFKSAFNVLLTFHFVCFCWIFFRAANMSVALQIIRQIAFNFNPQIFYDFLIGYKNVLTIMILGFGFHYIPNSFEFRTQTLVSKLPLLLQVALLLIVILIVVQFKSSGIQPFIYFQF